MGSVHRFVANDRTLVAGAVLAATNTRPSNDIRRVSYDATGFGRFKLEGPYTGTEDTEVEVEVTSDTIVGTPSVSDPQFVGVGSGELEVVAVDSGGSSETITFVLSDKGIPGKLATADLFGVTLRSKKLGVLGNDIRLSVTRNLTFTNLPFSTLKEIAPNTSSFDGIEFDFGAAATSSGEIPESAPRITFVDHPVVFRHWKRWDGSKWTYHLDPPTPWKVFENTQVQSVSGNYSLTITDGVVAENYTGISLYDFLIKIQSQSTLVSVVGSVVKDMSPGGMGSMDFPLRTDARALPAIMQVQSSLAKNLVGVSVLNAAAPTENLRITYVGNDVWSVVGGVSGTLPSAVTSAPYSSGPVGFTIPKIQTPVIDDSGIYASLQLVGRNADEDIPSVCFKPLIAGSLATSKTITFTYKRKPSEDCSCENLADLQLIASCLGLTLGGAIMALDPQFKSRLISLYQWRQSYISTNARFKSSADVITLDADAVEIELADRASSAFATCLEEIYTDSSALAAWDAAFASLQSFLSPLSGTPKIATQTGEFTMIRTYAAAWDIRGSGGVWYVDYRVTWRLLRGGVSTGAEASASSTVSYDAADAHAKETLEALKPKYLLEVSTTEPFVLKFQAQMDHVRAVAGLVPKSNASSTVGDGCWRDCPGATHWWVDETGGYLPICTNQPYHSARLDSNGHAVSTKEFGVGVVTACGGKLKEGDRITITLKGTGTTTGFVEGDRYTIPVIGAGDQLLSGGDNGSPTQTWTVSSDVNGALPQYLLDPTNPTTYTAGPVDVKITEGGIPYQEGDRWSLAVEGGQLRWRRDGGSWTVQAIEGPISLGDGLSLVPLRGAVPSYNTGDTHLFKAVSKYGVGRLVDPIPGSSFAWDATSVTITLDLGSVQPLEAFVLAMHTLPSTAVATLSGGNAAANEWTEDPTTVRSVMYHVLDRTARYLSLTITGTPTGGSIGWLWVGVPWEPSDGASDVSISKEFGFSRGSGSSSMALYRGKGSGGRIVWDHTQGTWLWPVDMPHLESLLNHVAENGLEPFVFVPNVNAPNEASLVQLDVDEVEVREWNRFQHKDTRVYSVELPLRGVLS